MQVAHLKKYYLFNTCVCVCVCVCARTLDSVTQWRLTLGHPMGYCNPPGASGIFQAKILDHVAISYSYTGRNKSFEIF